MVSVRKGDDLSFHFEALGGGQPRQIEYGTRRLISGRGTILYIFLNLLCVILARYKDILDASVGKKFEGVFDQRRIG